MTLAYMTPHGIPRTAGLDEIQASGAGQGGLSLRYREVSVALGRLNSTVDSVALYLRYEMALPETLLENLDDLRNNRIRGVTGLLVVLVPRLEIGVLLPGVAVRSGIVRSSKRGV
jgi:hypothetical protein